MGGGSSFHDDTISNTLEYGAGNGSGGGTSEADSSLYETCTTTSGWTPRVDPARGPRAWTLEESTVETDPLVQPGPAWSGLVWPGLGWSGLVRPGLGGHWIRILDLHLGG